MTHPKSDRSGLAAVAEGLDAELCRYEALAMGFQHVESGALVRSSYHADEQVPTRSKSVLAG